MGVATDGKLRLTLSEGIVFWVGSGLGEVCLRDDLAHGWRVVWGGRRWLGVSKEAGLSERCLSSIADSTPPARAGALPDSPSSRAYRSARGQQQRKGNHSRSSSR